MAGPRFSLENQSGYDTDDLRRFFAAGLQAQGITKHLRIRVTASPIRSRGCATVGGHSLRIAIAPPSRFSLRRLARLFEHECAHAVGLEHSAMPERVLYSLGPVPRWAQHATIRYRRRAPDQVRLLRYGDTRA